MNAMPGHNAARDRAVKGSEVRYEEIEKRYTSTYALRPTTLEIKAGEFFSIIGPSGSGKSTLLAVTVGFVSPSAGRILVNGSNIVSVPPFRRNIGMVFQSYSLFPHMTAAENIAFPLRMRKISSGEMRKDVDRALAMVRLEGLGNRRPAQLSGGQRQRVALARAAVYDPDLLLMDEPLSALDKNLREEMQNEIKEFQRALGATVLYVTHDQNEATTMSDRIAIMNKGAIEQVGSSQEIYERPSNRFVASFLGDAVMFEVAAMSGSGSTRQVETVEGFTLKTTSPVPPVKSLAVCVRPEHISLTNEKTGADNCLHGTVVDSAFVSGALVYRIQLDAGVNIRHRISFREDHCYPVNGETVFLSWSSSRTLLVGD